MQAAEEQPRMADEAAAAAAEAAATAAAEEAAAAADGAAGGGEESDFMPVSCPEGVVPGQLILVTAPDGRDVEAEVPEGISPGDEFEMFVGSVDAGEDAGDANVATSQVATAIRPMLCLSV